MGRAPCCDKANVKKGPWSPEEDAKLKSYIQKHGTGGNWIALPEKIGLKRCGKSCRLRWLNYLRPNLKRGGFSEHEDYVICSLYLSIGSRWSIIAAQLPGRTDNDIKNYWNTKLKKKLMGKQRRADQRGQRRLIKQETMEMSHQEKLLGMEAYPLLHINQDRYQVPEEEQLQGMMIRLGAGTSFYDHHLSMSHPPHRDMSFNIHGSCGQACENSLDIINPPATSTSVMNSMSPSCSPLPANGNTFHCYSNINILAEEVDDEFEYINYQEKLDGLSGSTSTFSGVDNMVTITPESRSLLHVYSHPQLFFNSQVSQQAIIPQHCVHQDSSRHFGMQHEWHSCTPMLYNMFLN